MKKKLKRDLAPNKLKKAIKTLALLCHTFVRHRDSIDDYEIGGYCFDCGKLVQGADFQAGHWTPSSSGGALLRYHPLNIHGQASSCNCGYRQEMVKVNYTLAMTRKYGEEKCLKLLALKNKTIKADLIFYLKMIELYKLGVEQDIVDYLESI